LRMMQEEKDIKSSTQSQPQLHNMLQRCKTATKTWTQYGYGHSGKGTSTGNKVDIMTGKTIMERWKDTHTHTHIIYVYGDVEEENGRGRNKDKKKRSGVRGVM